FRPTDAGPIHVTHPQARFYLADGRRIELDAAMGRVDLPPKDDEEAPPSPETLGASSSLPTSGTLTDVVIRVFPPGAAEPTMTATIPVLGFDADTNRMFTVETD